MAVNYLKKKKLYEVGLKLGYEMPILKDCEYRFYRGAEWLRFSDSSYCYEFCSMAGGNYFSVEKYYYDENSGKRVSVSHVVLNGWNRMRIDIAAI